MQESTRSKLTLFSRLWLVSTAVFIVLCIVAVIATMNEQKSLMGVAVLGTGVVFIIQLCQLVSAIVLRRWWYVAGGVVGIVVSLFVMLTSIVALAAGQYRPPVIFDDSDVSDSVAVSDTVRFDSEEESIACNIAVVVPDEALRAAVGKWLDAQMGGGYDGDMADMQALVDFHGRAHTDTLRSVLADGVLEDAELSYEAYTENLYETDKVVTYGLTITLDLGGAHPVTSEIGATFSKEDGRMLTWDIVRADHMSWLRGEIRQQLKDYFNVKTDAELADCLLGVEDVANIPLPVTPPYMTEEGFMFIYQQYEIAAYAAGMPCGTISYKDMKSCLTDWAQQLISASMSELVTAIISMDDPGEWFAHVNDEWQKYRKGDDYMGEFVVNNSRGYVRFAERREDEPGRVETNVTEFRRLDYSDSRCTLVVMASNFYMNDVPYDGQYGGVCFCRYDLQTYELTLTSGMSFGVEPPEHEGVITYALSPESSDIVATEHVSGKDESRFAYVWDGTKYKMSDKVQQAS